MVVVGVTPHQGGRESRSQGEAGQAGKYTWRTVEVSRNATVDTNQCVCRRANGNNCPDLKPTGEPCAVKVARTVRGRVVGKVSRDGNSLATYSTLWDAPQFQQRTSG